MAVAIFSLYVYMSEFVSSNLKKEAYYYGKDGNES